MGKFLDQLNLTHIDGDEWMVGAVQRHQISKKNGGGTSTVLPGFITDCASIPWLVRPLIGPKTGKYAPAAVDHDWLFQHPEDGVEEARTRRQVDQVFLEGLQDVGVGWWRRSTMYCAVRVGGGGAWSGYRAKDPIPMP